MPDLADNVTWDAALGQVRARGKERYQAEKARMRKLGVLDEKGRAKTKEWPADMAKGSKTDVAT